MSSACERTVARFRSEVSKASTGRKCEMNEVIMMFRESVEDSDENRSDHSRVYCGDFMCVCMFDIVARKNEGCAGEDGTDVANTPRFTSLDNR